MHSKDVLDYPTAVPTKMALWMDCTCPEVNRLLPVFNARKLLEGSRSLETQSTMYA